MQLLMSEAAFNLAGLRPAMGRLANAMVAALGPELQLGSPAYRLCKSVIREMQVALFTVRVQVSLICVIPPHTHVM